MRPPTKGEWLAALGLSLLLAGAVSLVTVAPVVEPCAVVRVDTVGAKVVRLCDGDTVSVGWVVPVYVTDTITCTIPGPMLDLGGGFYTPKTKTMVWRHPKGAWLTCDSGEVVSIGWRRK